MAHSIWLQNASYVIELEDTDVYGLLIGGRLGMPQAQKVYAESWGRGYAPLAALDYRSRDVTLSIRLQATSQDNWITTFRQIEELLIDVQRYYLTNSAEGDKAVLSVQMDGQTYPLEYDILDGECNADAIFQTTMNTTTAPRVLEVPIPLKIKPFGRPQQLSSVASGTLNNGGGVGSTNAAYSLAAPNGDVAAPAKLTLIGANSIRRLIIGSKARGNMSATDTFQFGLNCETGTAPGYTVTSGAGGPNSTGIAEASAHNGNVLRLPTGGTASAAMVPWVNWELTSGIDNYFGNYRAYLRVDTITTTPSSYLQAIRFSYGGSSGDAINNPDVTPHDGATANFLIDLGMMQIPHNFGPLDQVQNSFKMRLSVAQGQIQTSAHVDLDCLYLMPTEQFFDAQFSASLSSGDQVVLDSLQIQSQAYILDASGDVQPEGIETYTNTFFKAPVNRASRWFWLATSSTGLVGHNLTDQASMSLKFYPQYALGRTAAS